MSVYPLYLALHVGAAALWVGAACMQALLGLRVVRSGDPVRTLAFARDGHWLGLHVYLPSNLLVLLSGLLLVYSGNWSLTTLWLDLGFAGFAISIATGAAVLKPGWDRAAGLSEQDGAELKELVRRLVLVTHVDVGVLTGVLYLMVVKPTLREPLSLVVGAAAVVIVFLLSRRALTGERIRSHSLESVPIAPRG